jgi:hypothetical protein
MVKTPPKQERTDVLATSSRLIAESKELRKKAEKLQRAADKLAARFKRDHPD